VTILFQDNFDSHADTCRTGGDVPAGWDAWHQDDTSTTKDTVLHYAGEISSPGRLGTGKSLKIWRHSNWPTPNNYSGGLGYTALPNGHGHIFMRYYMKIPTAMNVTYSIPDGDYIKHWRWNCTSGQIYLNFFGDGANMRTSGRMYLIPDGQTPVDLIAAGDLDTTVWDGNWHCLELEMDLDNDIIRFYLDGSLYLQNLAVNWGGQANQDFDFMQHFSVGNIADNYTWQNSWQAIEFDDLVIADAYIGPLSGGTEQIIKSIERPKTKIFPVGHRRKY